MTQIREDFRVACRCGCGLVGKPRKTGQGHAIACKCKACQAGRNSKSGKKYHRVVGKMLNCIPKGYGASSHEESWTNSRWRVEVKTGKQTLKTVTDYENARSQSRASRAFGDTRTFIYAIHPAVKNRPALVVLEIDDFMQLVGEEID